MDAKMRRANRIATWTMICLGACSLLSGGCSPSRLFGANFSLSLVIPLGLGGTPGIANPFGIVQALVNSILGTQTVDGTPSSSPLAGTGTTPTVPPTVL